jgi:hypothetical protein
MMTDLGAGRHEVQQGVHPLQGGEFLSFPLLLLPPHPNAAITPNILPPSLPFCSPYPSLPPPSSFLPPHTCNPPPCPPPRVSAWEGRLLHLPIWEALINAGRRVCREVRQCCKAQGGGHFCPPQQGCHSLIAPGVQTYHTCLRSF